MSKSATKLHDLLPGSDPAAIAAEIVTIGRMVGDDFDAGLFQETLGDLLRLFRGEYPGFRASNTDYHDLEHTMAVVLAAARLCHGLCLAGESLSGRDMLLAVLGAMFHDTGLIQKKGETEGSGARFTVGHEERSLEVAGQFLNRRGLSTEAIADIGQMIRATTLSREINDIAFRFARVEMLAKVLATADLLAQMADRTYLEKLPLLYREFSEAGLPGFESELDLIKKTDQFYAGVALPRLRGQLGNVDRVMREHFKVRWQIDRDLYAEAIESNLSYLESLLDACGDAYTCYLDNLQRGGIVERILSEDGKDN